MAAPLVSTGICHALIDSAAHFPAAWPRRCAFYAFCSSLTHSSSGSMFVATTYNRPRR